MLIKNWRPTFLLNTDNKLISKALGKRIKKLLSSLVSLNQTAYSENIYIYICEGGQLIFDILEVRNILKIKSFLSKVVFEKAFDLVNHVFIFHALEKLHLGRIL